eukprot:CAMPEP_0174828680 /NCGR_PEP_ID=MMETSP1114-20130205/1481_1 /TAXON_ID=312471 /ORGANISM="Neobodo designis, Strain CCAP 1951/1" /LENGTH=949 /DNA_ID=CAMNT_0016062403 /DNA_START=46 /DNA_END=2895 /DNA_ORIENTATION=-
MAHLQGYHSQMPQQATQPQQHMGAQPHQQAYHPQQQQPQPYSPSAPQAPAQPQQQPAEAPFQPAAHPQYAQQPAAAAPGSSHGTSPVSSHGGPMPPQPYAPQQQPQQHQQTPQPQGIQIQLPDDVPGLRWTFKTYPNTGKPKKRDASQWGPPTPEMVVPLAAMYTPLHDPAASGTNSDDAAQQDKRVPVIQVGTQQELPKCNNCHAHLNAHARCDFRAQFWMCPGCLARNPLPPNVTDESHPAVARPTVEYELSRESAADTPPVFIFVVDVCIASEELEALKEALLRSLDWLPPHALVGVVSFGHGVTLWEPGFDDLNKCYAFRGNRSYSKQELLQFLGLPASALAAGTPTQQQQPQQQQQQQGVNTGPVSGRFLVPLEEAEFTITSVIEGLQVDPFTPPPRQRALRATGAALELAVSLIELAGGPARGGKVMLFTGGPCTRGPGAIVAVDKGEMIRSHRDLLDGAAPLHEKATEFFNGLEARLSDARVALDAVTMSLDQIGLLEMRACVDNTGGTMICGDSFTTQMFTDSFRRALLRAKLREDEGPMSDAPGCGFGAHIKVFTSSDTRVCGAIGPCRARHGPNAAATAQAQGDNRYISPIKVGVSDTTQWVASAVDAASTFTVVFDTEAEGAEAGSFIEPSSGQRRFVQFVMTYTTITGARRVRITSAAMPVARTPESSLYSQAGAFDQAAAAAVVSRMAVDIMERHENRSIDLTRRWIDRILVRFVKKYGSYRVNDPNSLRLASCFSLFPVFLFNLRRSEYFMVLNISPDETTFKRHYLRREPCDHCLLMIQPAVESYDMYSETATPVPLDSESIKRENVLLMDAFFNVAVLRGSTVEEWRKAGYQEKPEYASFKSLLERPERDAEAILSTRVPYPRYTNCDQHGSQARHVLTRLNPSVSHHSGVADSRSFSAAHKGPVSEVIYTDDASIQRFMTTLKQAAVTPETS